MFQQGSKYFKGGLSAAIIFVCCAMLFITRPSEALAADNGWDAALASIDTMHDSFTALESSNKLVKQQIEALRKQNNDKLKDINAKIQLIDKAKLDKLKSSADQAQKKYAPLLAQYTDLGKKATEARKRKDTKSATLYDLKRNRIKSSVDSAKKEIKQKKDALAAAKKQTAAKVKIVKDALAPVQTLKKQVTAENKVIASSNKTRTAADKRYKAAIKQGNAITAASELRTIVKELSQVQTSQKKIYEWEGKISQTLRAASAKLP